MSACSCVFTLKLELQQLCRLRAIAVLRSQCLCSSVLFHSCFSFVPLLFLFCPSSVPCLVLYGKRAAAAVQVQGWCHTMCLNRSRQRRRHRRGMEDWANLLEHALNADASPSFQHWLHHRSAWQWQPPAEQANHPEEALVSDSSPKG